MAAPRLSSSSSSSNQSIHNRDFWTEFFLLYESLPALWNTSSALYNDRAAKVAGYDVMVEKLREIEPNADREDVLRKINIFRTNFRREISRVNLSEKLGKQYKTTLWYFNLLSFLRNQEKKRHKKNTSYDEKCVMPKRRLTGLGSSFVVKKPRLQKTRNHKIAFHEFDENEFEEVAHNESLPENSIETSNREHFQNEFTNFSLDRKIQPKLEPVDEHVTDVIPEEIDGVEGFVQEEGEVELEDNETRQKEEDGQNGGEGGGGSAIIEQVTADANWYEDADATRTVRRQITQNNNNKKLLSQQYSVMSKHVNNIEVQTSEVKSIPKNSSGAADILAKSWAIQYEEMADDQKIYARKAIADILFDGCMGNLGRYTMQTNNVQILRQNSVNNVEHEVVRNDRTLLKQQHATQRYENVMNEFEECYVLDDGRAVKIKDWKVKI